MHISANNPLAPDRIKAVCEFKRLSAVGDAERYTSSVSGGGSRLKVLHWGATIKVLKQSVKV